MRKTSLFIVAGIILSVFLFGNFFIYNAQAQTTATLSLSPTSNTIAGNQTFTVSINLDTAGAPADGVDVYLLRFNPSILQVVDSNAGISGVQISPGTLMPNTAANTADNTAGTIQFSQSVSGGSSFTGSGVLATITFRGVVSGTSAVTFDFTPGSTADTNVAYQGVDRLSGVTNANYTVDATLPSAPSGLTATAISDIQINLSWTASTDNIGVTGYLIERCQGSTCSNFSQSGTSSSTSYNDTGLTAATTYRYRVRATDGVGNLSAYSTIVSATTQQAFDFTLSNGGSKSVEQGSSVTNSITVTLLAGSTKTVSFGASGLPSGVTASFSPTSCSPNCNSTLTLTIPISAPVGTSTITVTGTAGTLTKNTAFSLTINSMTYQRTITILLLEGLSTNVVAGTLNVYNSARSLLKSYPFITNSSGNAVITFDVPIQTALLQVKASPFLTRLITQNLSITTPYIFPMLLTGDINQDNIVNSIDYSILNTNWFTSNATSDLNQDGIVNSIDFSLLNKNWFVMGES